MEMQEWFKNAKYGMMIHWGLYSVLQGEYKGQPSAAYAEWIMSKFRIPIAEYEKISSAFNPIYFDADEWVSFAKECGMEYIVITAKHHDGFALFDSKSDSFNVKNTPFGRDIIAELSVACKKQGIKLGLYYSQDLDWHEENGGGYNTICKEDSAGTAACNDWDFPDKTHKDYEKCLQRKILPQIRELLTNYGDIALIWFDVPETATYEQSRLIYNTVKSLQSDCLVNSRLGNGMYDYVSLGDNEIPDTREKWEEMSRIDPEKIDWRDINGFKPSRLGLYETAATMNESWGFNYRDHNWKTPEQIAANRKRLNDMGINYLINVGPDHLGRIPGLSQEILRKASKL